MTKRTALVVEDDPQLQRFLRAALSANDYDVIAATTCREALQLAPSHNPDIVLLDLGLPDGDGLDVTRRLREWSRAAIIVLSARGQESDKVAALDLGADDYLTKPFGTAELLARMRVALRHSERLALPADHIIECDGLRIDVAGHTVTLHGAEVHLTPTAFRVLSLLARHADKVLTYRHILKEVWGPGAVEQAHYVRVQMAELRKRLEADAARPRWLVTEPGVGYRFRSAVV